VSEGELEEIQRKKEYYKNYYKAHRDNILTKANAWNQKKRESSKEKRPEEVI